MGTITIRAGKLEIDVRDKADLRAVLAALGEHQLQLPLENNSGVGLGRSTETTRSIARLASGGSS